MNNLKINNFISDYQTILESDCNIETYKIFTFFEIISIKNQVSLINNLVIIRSENLECMCGRTNFPAQGEVWFRLDINILFGQ